jgi:hypothetical protein
MAVNAVRIQTEEKVMSSLIRSLAMLAVVTLLTNGCGYDTPTEIRTEKSGIQGAADTKVSARQIGGTTPAVGIVKTGQVGFIMERDTAPGLAPGARVYLVASGPHTRLGKYDLPPDTKFKTIACGDQPFTYRYRVGQDGHYEVLDRRDTIEISGRINMKCDDTEALWALAHLIDDDDIGPEKVFYRTNLGAVDFTGYAELKECIENGLQPDSEECQARLLATLRLYMGKDRWTDQASLTLKVTSPKTP